MNMPNPKISVIMSAYNSAKYIDGAILSVLNQTLKDWELIIVNDCSTDNTLEIIKLYSEKEPRIQVINNELNLQPALSRNRALETAKGDYIAILDSDDIALPKRLEIQSAFLDNNSEFSLVGCAAEIINDNGKITGTKKPSTHFNILKFKLATRNPIVHSGVMCRKSAFDKVSGYNNGYLHSEDYKLYTDLAKTSKITTLPDTLIQYRYTPGAISVSTDSRKIQWDHALLIGFENISNYIQLPEDKAHELINTLNNVNLSAKSILSSIKTYGNLTKAYIIKEDLDTNQARQIWNIYNSDKKLLLVRYLKSKFPKLVRMFKLKFARIKNEYSTN